MRRRRQRTMKCDHHQPYTKNALGKLLYRLRDDDYAQLPTILHRSTLDSINKVMAT